MLREFRKTVPPDTAVSLCLAVVSESSVCLLLPHHSQEVHFDFLCKLVQCTVHVDMFLRTAHVETVVLMSRSI